MITNFISKSLEFIQLLICKKNRGGYFCLNEMRRKIAKGTLTPKMPFLARFSCCATINFNSILKYFPRGVMMINFISKSLEFIQLLICKKIARVIFV